MQKLPPEAHHFIRLSDGECHYRLGGKPSTKPTLLMIHGATVPGWEFDRLVPFLNAAGLRTLVPDLYGHGLSARPRIRYDYELFTRQLNELCSALALGESIDLFGHSLGAAIGARLACRAPQAYRRLALAAPLLDFTATSRPSQFIRLPIIGEMLMQLYVKPTLMRRRQRRYRDIEDGRWIEMFRRHLKIPGFGYMMLSMLRSNTLGDQSLHYRQLNQLGHSLLVLRGSDDDIFPQHQFEALRGLMPSADFIEIAHSPHAFVIADPEKLAPHLIEFFA